MVARLENWSIRLSNYLMERRNMPFQWGTNDCMQFVAGAINALTGTNFSPEYSGYSDEAGAVAMLEANGGIYGILTTCLGHKGSKRVKQAGRGDVVLHTLDGITLAGVVDDAGKNIAFVSADGFRKLPLSNAIHYWSY